MSIPLVAIIGRPNVGKSTLFNRLVKSNQAIVDDTPGITRDRLYRQCAWNGVDFMLVDTGGLLVGADEALEALVSEQARVAMDQADLILFMIDSRVGILEDDLRIARDLKKAGKNVIIVSNKVDDPSQEFASSEFYSLGFAELVPVSALNGLNSGELLDSIVAKIPGSEHDEAQGETRVAIVGRPNVGKSSLVNAMIGREVAIVADLPGTTRDSIDTSCRFENVEYLLIDTAGLKKKSVYKDQLTYYTALRTLRAISRCDIAVVVIDAIDGLVTGDLKIANEAADLYKGLVFAYNKWDLAKKDDRTAEEIRRAAAEKAPSFAHVPMLFISALTGLRVVKVWQTVREISAERKKRVDTSELNRFLEKMTERRPPSARQGKMVRIYYATQAEDEPPTFVFFSNYPKLIDSSYARYLENRIRETFGFNGVPIKLIFRRRK